MKRASIAAFSVICLTSCSPVLVQDATQDLDNVYRHLSQGTAPDPGYAMDLSALLATAQVKGPDFLAADVAAAKARLDLDERKSQRRPRVSVALRTQYSIGLDREIVSGRDYSTALDWDIAAALFSGDRESLEIAQQYLPVQAELSDIIATGDLMDAYFTYESALAEKRELVDDIALNTCRQKEAEVEVELGNLGRIELENLRLAQSGLRTQIGFANSAVDAARRDVLFRAGVAETARLKSGQDPMQVLSAPPASLTSESCYARSGYALRDQLLMAGAATAIKGAGLQRYGSLDILLPAELSPSSGLKLNALISLLIPLVDQNDGERAVQEARASLLDLAIAAQKNRQSFDTRLSQSQLELSRRSAELDQARRAAAQIRPGMTCDDQAGRRRADLAVNKARIAYRRAKAQLALLCAPIDNSDPRPDLMPKAALDLAAPDS